MTLSVGNRQAVKQRAFDAFSGRRRGAHIAFASVDLLRKVLTAKRWGLLKAMAGGGAMSERAAKAVDGDHGSRHREASHAVGRGHAQVLR